MFRQKLSLLIIFLSAASTGFAETYIVNTNAYFIRSDPRFGASRSNVVGVLTNGATFQLLEKVIRPDGSEAWRIRVIDPSSRGHVNPSPTESYWVYRPRNSRSFGLLRSEGPPVTVSGSCNNCETSAAVTPIAPRDRRGLEDIVQNVTETQEQPATVPPPTRSVSPHEPPESDIEFPNRRTIPRTPGDISDEAIARYSSSSAVQKSIDYAMTHKAPRSRSQCYRYVKEALACAPRGRRGNGECLNNSWFASGAARNAVTDLKRSENGGFVNLLEYDRFRNMTATQAPKGAVLVYSSGVPCRPHDARDCGHVEIKTNGPGEDGYVSDFYLPDPINYTARVRSRGRTGYQLIGIMIKP